MTVHRDDFISEDGIEDLRWVEKKLLEHFQLQTEILSAGPGLQKDARVLNRVITLGRWRNQLGGGPSPCRDRTAGPQPGRREGNSGSDTRNQGGREGEGGSMREGQRGRLPV